jgi:hypothetical protein
MAMFRHLGAGRGLEQKNASSGIGRNIHDATVNARPNPTPGAELIT